MRTCGRDGATVTRAHDDNLEVTPVFDRRSRVLLIFSIVASSSVRAILGCVRRIHEHLRMAFHTAGRGRLGDACGSCPSLGQVRQTGEVARECEAAVARTSAEACEACAVRS